MAEIHIVGIKYIEINDQADLEFKYKPEVPKLKLVGTILNPETEEDEEGVLFLTQKQFNQIMANKEIDFKTIDDRWYLVKPLNKEQTKKVGLVNIESEFLGSAGELKCYEAVKVS